MTQNDVMQLLIGKDLGAVSLSTAVGSPIVSYADLLDGEIAVCNPHNIVVDETTILADKFVAEAGCKLIQRSGTDLIISDLIKQDNIRNYKGSLDAVGVEQVSHIGYDGATATTTIEVANSKLYVVRVELKETDFTGFGQEAILNVPYKSAAAAAEADIAGGLALGLSRTMRRQTKPPIMVEMLNAAAVAAGNDFLGDSTVLNGIDSFTNTESGATGDAGVYAAATAIVVGDYVRIGAVGLGTALTSGVYKVIALSGVSTALATITVDRPIEAASGTYAAATSDIEVIASATAIAANFGIRLTGIARQFLLPKYKYSKVSFHIGLDSVDSFGDTNNSTSVQMTLGRGTYEQIAQLEYDLLGNRGDVNRGDFLYVAEKADAVSGKLYDVIGINFFGDHATAGVGATPQRNKQLLIAFETGYLTAEPPAEVVKALDAYAGHLSGLVT